MTKSAKPGGINKGTALRGIALDILLKAEDMSEKQEDLVNRVFSTHTGLDKKDRAFIKRLAEGTVERRITLDLVIDRFSNVKTEKMKSVIRNVLRLGTYELLFMDSVPARAVCHGSVELVKLRNMMGLSGFVNAVLRRIASERPDIEAIEDPAVRYSFPDWIYELFSSEYGEEKAVSIMKASLENRPVYIRLNITRTDREELKKLLRSENIEALEVPSHPEAFEIRNFGDITEVPGFREGLFSVQDISSMCVGEETARILEKMKPEHFLAVDVCASPGGKSCHVAEILTDYGKKTGYTDLHVISRDVSERKTERLIENRERLGLSVIETGVHDAREKEDGGYENRADLVIADLPCSGLGVTGRKNDIKYRLKKEDILSLQELQREILSNTDALLKEGGHLIFSVCTITREETEEQAQWIERTLGYRREAQRLFLPGDGGADGFYYAVFNKLR